MQSIKWEYGTESRARRIQYSKEVAERRDRLLRRETKRGKVQEGSAVPLHVARRTVFCLPLLIVPQPRFSRITANATTLTCEAARCPWFLPNVSFAYYAV